MTAMLVVAAVAAAVLTAVLCGVVHRYARRRAILDIPNERSSHSTPTPRGGGLAIAAVTLGGIGVLGLAGLVPPRLAIALGGGGLAVAGIGWADDRRGLSPGVRFAVHLLAAVWAVAWLGGMPELRTGREALELGLLGGVLAVLGVVWAINLYNFMDGIDGLAGIEALAVGLLAAALLSGTAPAMAVIAALIGGAGAGFLVWNWAPARLFMGDVGSGLLGYLFAALAVASERTGALPALGWLALLGVFFVDATLTLVRRAASGERWYTPHRTHAYQRAVQAGLSHAQVAMTVLGVTLALGAIVWYARRHPDALLACTAAALLLPTALYLAVPRGRGSDGPSFSPGSAPVEKTGSGD